MAAAVLKKRKVAISLPRLDPFRPNLAWRHILTLLSCPAIKSLSLGYIVLDGGLAQKGHRPQIFTPCDVCCGQTARWIKMSLGTEVGLSSGTLLHGNRAPPPYGAQQPPILGSCILWQIGGWIKMPPGTEVGLSAGDTVLDNTSDSQALRAEYCVVGTPHNTAIQYYIVLIYG